MNGVENYYAFILAAIILNITPGADTIYILTRSISQGQRAGIISVFGIVSGAFILVILAVFGLSAILAKSTVIFTIVKSIGAIYLMYMGIQILAQKSNLRLNSFEKKQDIEESKLYKQGLLTNLLNPKVALFFLSLLPQFVKSTHVNNATPYLILGLTFITTGTLWCMFLAITSSKISKIFREKPSISKAIEKVSGLVFLGLGLQLLFSKQK